MAGACDAAHLKSARPLYIRVAVARGHRAVAVSIPILISFDNHHSVQLPASSRQLPATLIELEAGSRKLAAVSRLLVAARLEHELACAGR